jgi:hypothetical protein
MGTRRRLALLALAVALAVLVIAVPAQAATVASGSSQMTVSPAVTHTIHAAGMTVDVVSPATITTKWNKSGAMYWWIRVPMTSSKPGSWNPSTGVGTFYHSGSFRFINTATSPQKVFRAEGLRIIATNKTTYQLSVTYPASDNVSVQLPSASYTRIVLAESTHAPKITNSGKSYKIDGVQFKLTTAGRDAIHAVTGVTLPTDVVLLDTDILPVLK